MIKLPVLRASSAAVISVPKVMASAAGVGRPFPSVTVPEP